MTICQWEYSLPVWNSFKLRAQHIAGAQKMFSDTLCILSGWGWKGPALTWEAKRGLTTSKILFVLLELKTRHFSPYRLIQTKMCDNSIFWWRRGNTGTPVHCWWEYKLVDSLASVKEKIWKRLLTPCPAFDIISRGKMKWIRECSLQLGSLWKKDYQ